ncbi:MAG: hypothetical protein ACT4OP_12115 [Actinomycetota bacterium]
MAEGPKVVRRLLDRAGPCPRYFVTRKHLPGFDADAAEVFVVPEEIVTELGFPFHRGVLAVAVRPEPLTIETVLADSPSWGSSKGSPTSRT